MAVDDAYVGCRIFRQKLLDCLRQDLGGRVRNIADGDPRNDIASCGLDLVQAVFDLAERDLNASGEFGPVWGRRDTGCGTPVEGPPQLTLQLAGRTVQRRLRNPQRPRRGIE